MPLRRAPSAVEVCSRSRSILPASRKIIGDKFASPLHPNFGCSAQHLGTLFVRGSEPAYADRSPLRQKTAFVVPSFRALSARCSRVHTANTPRTTLARSESGCTGGFCSDKNVTVLRLLPIAQSSCASIRVHGIMSHELRSRCFKYWYLARLA